MTYEFTNESEEDSIDPLSWNEAMEAASEGRITTSEAAEAVNAHWEEHGTIHDV